MGWFKRSVAALFISAAALVGYSTAGTTQETTPAVVEERTYRKPQLVPAASDNIIKYKLASAATYALATTLITSAAGGVGYAVGQRRRHGYRPAELDDDRGEMPIIRPIKYDTLSAEEKAKVDAQLTFDAIKTKMNSITKIERQDNAPEYKTVVSQLVDNSVRQDYIAHGKSIESILGRFDINAKQLRQIVEPYAEQILSHDLRIEELKQKEAENRAELIRRQIQAARVKLV